MSLHNEIMNIPTTPDFVGWVPLEKNAYKHGHRDARHAAAEATLKYDAYIEELEGYVTDHHSAELVQKMRKGAGL